MQTVIVTGSAKAMPDVDAYIVGRIRNPDPGSVFDKRSAELRQVPDSMLVETLTGAGYGGIVAKRNGRIIAHLFFERRAGPDSLHIFAVHVEKDMRRQGIATKVVETLLEQAAHYNLLYVRLFGGGNDAMASLYQKIVDERSELPCIACPEMGIGWVQQVV